MCWVREESISCCSVTIKQVITIIEFIKRIACSFMKTLDIPKCAFGIADESEGRTGRLFAAGTAPRYEGILEEGPAADAGVGLRCGYG